MSTPIESAGRVVVGTDGSPTGNHAVAWAARVAQARRLPLLIVTAVPEFPLPRRGRAYSSLDGRAYLDALGAQGRAALAAAEREARAAYPELEIAGQLVEGTASEILVQASKDADLVVVAARGHSAPLAVRALGGTADAVATHSHGQVMVVPEASETRDDGPVVVGMDDSREAAAALEAAAVAAERAGRPLLVLHAAVSAPPAPEALPGVEIDDDALLASWGHHLQDQIEPLAARHPGLAIEHRVVLGRAVDALVAASADAHLVVVGSRGRGGLAGLLLGSTSREVLRRSAAPVLVVRPQPGRG